MVWQCGSCTTDSVIKVAFSPRNDLVKNCAPDSLLYLHTGRGPLRYDQIAGHGARRQRVDGAAVARRARGPRPVWKSNSALGYPPSSRRRHGDNFASMAWNRHAVEQTQLRKHVASMAWGARSFISIQAPLRSSRAGGPPTAASRRTRSSRSPCWSSCGGWRGWRIFKYTSSVLLLKPRATGAPPWPPPAPT